MTIDELIKEGEAVREKCFKTSDYGGYLSGENYEKWIAKAIIFMDTNYKKNPVYDRFIEGSKNAVGNGVEHYDKMMGILKAIKESE